MQILYVSDQTADDLRMALFASDYECSQLTIATRRDTLSHVPKGYRLIARTAKAWEKASLRYWKLSEKKGLPEDVQAAYERNAAEFANGARKLLELIPLACPNGRSKT